MMPRWASRVRTPRQSPKSWARSHRLVCPSWSCACACQHVPTSMSRTASDPARQPFSKMRISIPHQPQLTIRRFFAPTLGVAGPAQSTRATAYLFDIYQKQARDAGRTALRSPQMAENLRSVSRGSQVSHRTAVSNGHRVSPTCLMRWGQRTKTTDGPKVSDRAAHMSIDETVLSKSSQTYRFTTKAPRSSEASPCES